ncbi:ABC transporter substrate-binding protein [Cohnella cellulosilytica]|uniref:ABC transporter substrate-binding protein n=1 Tax=Cohnella cellulosilytica TaxID=986710 RepID=A0ABW2FIQ4_9BACL
MKKWSFIAISLLLLASIVSACGGKSNNNEAQSSSPQASGETGAAAPKGKITFAYWGAQTEADAIKQAIDSFQSATPGIEVESQWIQKDYLTKLQTMIAGGTAPDVILISGGDLPGFASAFQPLQVDGSLFSSPTLLDSMSLDGQVYAAPFVIKPKVMAINVDLFEKNNIPLPSKTEPMTPEQFYDISKQITSGEGADKIFGSEPLWLGNWIYAFGGQYYSDDLSKSTLGDAEAVAAGEFIVKTKLEGLVPNDTERKGQNMTNWFLGGRIGMYSDFGPWSLPQMADVQGFNWDLVPFPGNGGSKEVNGLAMSKDSKNAEAAQAFITYMTQNEEAQKVIGGNKSAYGIPVLAGATSSFESIFPDKNLNAFVFAAENQHVQEAQKRTNEINNEMKAIDDMTPIGIGDHDVKEVFPRVAEKIDKILQQD